MHSPTWHTSRALRSPIRFSSRTTSSARFGGLTAVDIGHTEIQRGSITALIGPNGAGKTTFFNLLTGFDRPDNGSWTFNGKRSPVCRPTRWPAAAWCAPSSSPRRSRS